MPRNNHPILVLAAACMLSACQAGAPATPAAPAAAVAAAPAALAPVVSHAPAAAAPAKQGASIVLRADVRKGGTRRLLAEVSEYTQDDVDKLVVTIALKSTPDTPLVSDTLLAGELGDELTFTNLKNDTSYRIQARAYEDVGGGNYDLISVDASSYLDIDVEREDALIIDKIPVQLEDVTFSGVASGSIEVKPGTFVYPGDEGISHAPKAP